MEGLESFVDRSPAQNANIYRLHRVDASGANISDTEEHVRLALCDDNISSVGTPLNAANMNKLVDGINMLETEFGDTKNEVTALRADTQASLAEIDNYLYDLSTFADANFAETAEAVAGYVVIGYLDVFIKQVINNWYNLAKIFDKSFVS